MDGLKACRDKVVAIVAEKAEHAAKEGKFKAEKDQVRAMLDISGPEHVKRVEGIIKAALDYIDKSQVTVSELRDELGGIEGQADKLVKINSQMITVVAILDKGIDLATAANKDKVQGLSTAREGEDTLARLERERKKNDFERHVTALLDSGRSTKKTVADLEKDAVRRQHLPRRARQAERQPARTLQRRHRQRRHQPQHHDPGTQQLGAQRGLGERAQFHAGDERGDRRRRQQGGHSPGAAAR